MATIQQFEDLDVWKLSREIVNSIYDLTSESEFSKDYALRDQIRRSAIGILSNIAEGFESGSDNQFSRYLKIAKGSAGEARAQLYIALDRGYACQKDFNILKDNLVHCSKKLSRLINYLDSSNNKTKEFEIIYKI